MFREASNAEAVVKQSAEIFSSAVSLEAMTKLAAVFFVHDPPKLGLFGVMSAQQDMLMMSVLRCMVTSSLWSNS